MKLKSDWLWDRKITPQKAKSILSRPDDAHFLGLASLLLSRKNSPQEVFKNYIKTMDFLQNWQRIKRQMRKDNWNNPRIEFWQAIYETLKKKNKIKMVNIYNGEELTKPKNEFYRTIADKLKMIRKQKGISQGELAKRLKVSQQAISHIEMGRDNASLLTLKKIVDALGAKLDVEISG
ncbi:MAG: helix-turn-helix transcriptional regulator [Candidatus Omnitrophota bacterium]